MLNKDYSEILQSLSDNNTKTDRPKDKLDVEQLSKLDEEKGIKKGST